MSKELPIKSFFQVIKIILVLAALIFIISTLIGKSPVLIFSGLGAMTAIIMLIFKDSILGLVAGIQLSANRMVARGDWIEMPKFGADGEVLEVALTTVKIRNWDKTITTIPTYALISDSFKNWRGMSSSGVRRIKRSVSLDMSTVAFLDEQKPCPACARSPCSRTIWLQQGRRQSRSWNAENADPSNPLNARSLTNLGTFRAYMREYLKSHPKIAQNETLLVRQLQPSENGIPIELYIFTTDNRWAYYEDIQSDIFDHLLSVLPEFGLRAFPGPLRSLIPAPSLTWHDRPGHDQHLPHFPLLPHFPTSPLPLPFPMNLFDTLTRTKRELKPIDGKTFRFYCCGPTVYGPAHIGNFRTFVMHDVFRRVLETGGMKTLHVRNITDVDDKTIRDSQAAGKSLKDFTSHWLGKFHVDCERPQLPAPAHRAQCSRAHPAADRHD